MGATIPDEGPRPLVVSHAKAPNLLGAFLFHPRATCVYCGTMSLGRDLRRRNQGVLMVMSKELVEALVGAVLALVALIEKILSLAHTAAGG